VDAGEIVKHDFVFTNVGSAVLEIVGVQPGCGCTTAGEWNKRVEPGAAGVIPLQLNSTAFTGKITKPATVTCNDPSQSNVVLQITGTVWKPIDVTPPMAVFNFSSEVKIAETRVVRIVNNAAEPLALSDLNCPGPFQAKLKEVQPGKEFILEITASPPFVSNSPSVRVTLKTSSQKIPVISVSTYVVVTQPVVVLPGQINLPTGPLANPVTSVVIIRNDGTNSLVLSEPRVNAPGAEASVVETVMGRIFSLSVNFPVGLQVKPGEKVEVTVKSNHPKFPLLRVPVVQPQPHNAAASGVSAPSPYPIVPAIKAP
jgi:hypothetical protein